MGTPVGRLGDTPTYISEFTTSAHTLCESKLVARYLHPRLPLCPGTSKLRWHGRRLARLEQFQ